MFDDFANGLFYTGDMVILANIISYIAGPTSPHFFYLFARLTHSLSPAVIIGDN